MATTKACVCAALVLVCLVAAAQSRQLVWVGSNLNYATESNWEGQVPLDSSDEPASRVDSRSDVPYTSYIDGETYSFGSKWQLPDNGKFVFDSQSTVRIKFNEANSGPASRFLGPRDDYEGFQFNCPDNWNVWRGPDVDGTASPEVPRVGDDVLFLTGNAYYVVSQERLTNVDSVTIGTDFNRGAEVNGVTYDTCESLPENQFAGIDCDSFFINSEEACVGDLQLNGECLYFNVCPTEEQMLEEQERIVQAARDNAAAVNMVLAEEVSRDIDFEIPYDFIHPDDPLLVNGIFESEERVTTFITLLADILLEDSENEWNVTEVSVSVNPTSETVSISGSVTSSRALLLKLSEDQLATGDIVAPTSLDDASPFDLYLYASTVEAFTGFASAEAESALATAIDNCCGNDTSCGLILDIAEVTAEYITDVGAFVSLVCPDLACSDSAEDIAAFITEFAANNSISVSEEEASDLAVLFAGNTFTEEALGLFECEDFTQASDLVDQTMTLATPEPTTIEGEEVSFGFNLPATVLDLLVNTEHAPAFLELLTERLLNRLPWEEIVSMSVDVVNNNRARRAEDANAPHITLQLTYVVNCVPITCDAYTYQYLDMTYLLIQSVGDNVASSLVVEPQECYVDPDGGVLAEPDMRCLQDLANSYLSPDCDAACATELVLNEVGCGPAGTNYNTNECTVTPANAADIAQLVNAAVLTQTTTTTTTTAATTINSGSTMGNGGSTTPLDNNVDPDASSSGATGSIGIIGGAAGGALIIIVIIIFVVLRRRSGSKQNPDQDNRNVVAFENPMYDAPGPQVVPEQLYATAEDEDADGLYDEPAFNANMRENPVYQSTEGLDADEDEEESGYLDVAAEDDDDE